MVYLRAEKTKTKGYSLYLDIYKNGQRERKRLQLYVSKDYTKGGRIKKDDKFNWKLANQLKVEAQHKLNLEGTSFVMEYTEKGNFIDFFKKKNKKKNNSTYTYALKKLIEFKGHELKFNQVRLHLLKGFKSYLKDNGVSDNTANTYLQRFSIIWNEAMKEDLTTRNPFKNFTMPKVVKAKKTYLTIDDLKVFSDYSNNPNCDLIKKAFLFSCFTGLRVSDIYLLKWSNIVDNNQFIEFRQKKSKTNILRIPLHPVAKNIIQSLSNDNDCIFPLKSYSHTTLHLKKIAQDSIKKNISFHSSRHTFATLLTTYGGDYYATKVLLGHSNQDVTAGYSHLTDKRKIEIVNKIPVL